MDVNKLKILQASHLSQRYALEDKIMKEYPQLNMDEKDNTVLDADPAAGDMQPAPRVAGVER
jgi:hypothetical protein